MSNSHLDYDYPSSEARPVTISKLTDSKVTSASVHSSRFSNSPSAYNFSNLNLNQNNPSISLNSVVPLSKSNLVNTNSCYYDVPKNIPVATRYQTSSQPQKFPVNDVLSVRPQLPHKSPVIQSKIISSYPTTKGNATLSRQSTSKPLPPLPNEMATTNSTNQKCFSPPNYDVIPTKPTKYINVNNNQNDDDEDCDYDYDYVCLESKKKLDAEDENVKKLISNNLLQMKFERLVLNSTGLIDLQHLEKSFTLQTKDSSNSKVLTQLLQSYSHILYIAKANFESWTKLNLEILERHHPASVYINFTKHILLSGQNLLLVSKSLNRHFGQIESLSHFADQFYDYLRQIVVKTKKAASEQHNSEARKEMAKSIQTAVQFTSNLKINSQTMFPLK